MQREHSWDHKAVQFMQDSFLLAKPGANDLLREAAVRIKKLTGADIAVILKKVQDGSVDVYYARPDYLKDIELKEPDYSRVLDRSKEELLYYPDLSRADTAFRDLFPAMYSGMILPVYHKKDDALLLFGWSAQQGFEASFRTFMSLVQERLRELFRNDFFRKVTLVNIDLMASVFNTMPHAIIYFEDNGLTSWINLRAAALLELSVYGEQATPLVASLLEGLSGRADNAEEIGPVIEALRKDRGRSIDQWVWRYSGEGLPFSRLCVTTRPVRNEHSSGRVWIFEDITRL